jgi:hypothetical protein
MKYRIKIIAYEICGKCLSSKISGQLLSVPYLMEKHPEINDDQAEQLLKFCKKHTIRHKECYGDGSIMYPMWKESNYY